MHHAPHQGPGLAARLLSSGWDASLALLACMALALVVAHDFDRARRHLPWATTPLSRFMRLVCYLSRSGAGIYVALVSIPKIHPWFAQGFVEILRPEVFLLTVSGLWPLRTGDGGTRGRPARSHRKASIGCAGLSRVFRYGLLLLVLLSDDEEPPCVVAIAFRGPGGRRAA